MINIIADKKCLVSEDVKKICENRNVTLNELENHTKQLKKHEEQLNECFHKMNTMVHELEKIKSDCERLITEQDLDDLVVDIRNSFEMFVNSTPRPNNDVKVVELENKLMSLENKIDSLGMNNIEIIEQPKKHIPKLNLKKKTS